jgi:hypothetical protein
VRFTVEVSGYGRNVGAPVPSDVAVGSGLIFVVAVDVANVWSAVAPGVVTNTDEAMAMKLITAQVSDRCEYLCHTYICQFYVSILSKFESSTCVFAPHKIIPIEIIL